ncbi:hypothetical protein AOLI_G00082770 [Acnodon oligacanthus]
MSAQIEDFVSQCAVCNASRNSSTREPLLSHSLPGRPWPKIGTDLFHYNEAEYLLCVDYYSKFPEISKLSNTTAQGVIMSLRSVFARHGIPDITMSVNGPQYASTVFSNFARDWEFKHIVSSLGHAESNGQAERTMQTNKNLLKTAQDGKGDLYIALLEYRNMPLEGIGYSPAQLLMGRRLKSKLPTSNVLLTPESKIQIQDKQERRQLKQKSYYDRQTKSLPNIYTGDKCTACSQLHKMSPLSPLIWSPGPGTPVFTRFRVQSYHKKKRPWVSLLICSDLSTGESCDLTIYFNNPHCYYLARVQAFIPDQESNWTSSKLLYPILHSKKPLAFSVLLSFHPAIHLKQESSLSAGLESAILGPLVVEFTGCGSLLLQLSPPPSRGHGRQSELFFGDYTVNVSRTRDKAQFVLRASSGKNLINYLEPGVEYCITVLPVINLNNAVVTSGPHCAYTSPTPVNTDSLCI